MLREGSIIWFLKYKTRARFSNGERKKKKSKSSKSQISYEIFNTYDKKMSKIVRGILLFSWR